MRRQLLGLIMSIRPVDLTGGKSVYCFNESQLQRAFDLAEGDSESGVRIRAEVGRRQATGRLRPALPVHPRRL